MTTRWLAIVGRKGGSGKTALALALNAGGLPPASGRAAWIDKQTERGTP
jgi:energy-coupling factor transporter ATP-binding protein EcfA2